MEIAAALGLATLMVGQFSLLWYRLGKMEQKINDHCRANGSGKEP